MIFFWTGQILRKYLNLLLIWRLKYHLKNTWLDFLSIGQYEITNCFGNTELMVNKTENFNACLLLCIHRFPKCTGFSFDNSNDDCFTTSNKGTIVLTESQSSNAFVIGCLFIFQINSILINFDSIILTTLQLQLIKWLI